LGKLRYKREEGEVVDTCNVCGGSGKVKQEGSAVLLAPHLEAALAKHVTDSTQDQRVDVLVTQMTRSTGAIYRADWFIEKAITSLNGFYPEFRQIDFSNNLEEHLGSRGFS